MIFLRFYQRIHSPVNESAQCEKCGHELVTHGDLQNCGPEEFERKLQVLGSIERLTQEIEKTEDPAERSKRISDLAKVIGNPGYEAVDRRVHLTDCIRFICIPAIHYPENC